jgi:hypothetical protein
MINFPYQDLAIFGGIPSFQTPKNALFSRLGGARCDDRQLAGGVAELQKLEPSLRDLTAFGSKHIETC